MSLDSIITFVNAKECATAIKDNVKLAILQLLDPKGLVSITTAEAFSGDLLQDLLASPIGQLGQDFVAAKVNDITATAVDKLTGEEDAAINKFEDSLQRVMNTFMAALSVYNDLIMVLLQNVARAAITALDAKRTTLLTLQERLRFLHNAIVIAAQGTGNGKYDAYLNRIRQALVLLNDAEIQLQSVRSTYAAKNIFLSGRLTKSKTNLQKAIDLLAPHQGQIKSASDLIQPRNEDPALRFDIPYLLEAINVPTDEQQINAMLSIPLLAKDCLLAADQYFIQVAQINGLLANFLVGLSLIQTSVGSKLKDYSLSIMDTSLLLMDLNRRNIATAVNGSPTAILAPVDPTKRFKTSAHHVAGQAIDWLIQLKAALLIMNTIPTQGLNNLQLGAALQAAYFRACKAIQSKNDRRSTLAILHANQGQEDFAELEFQLIGFLGTAQAVILQGRVPPSLIITSKGVQQRLSLSLAQDAEIREALLQYVNTPVPPDIQTIMDNLSRMFKLFGMDRASDLLASGQFDKFFNMNSKESTYAGAALVGLAELSKCLGINFPFDLNLSLKGFFFAFQLGLKRTAANSIRLQIKFNLNKIDQCGLQIEQLRGLGSLCGLKDTLAPSKMFKKLASAFDVTSVERFNV